MPGILPGTGRTQSERVQVPSTLTMLAISNKTKASKCHVCSNQVQGLNKLITTVFLAHGLASVSYSQRGSDTNRCGTPAQSGRFTLHCQPRDHVFWQCTTYWYRIQPLHNNITST